MLHEAQQGGVQVEFEDIFEERAVQCILIWKWDCFSSVVPISVSSLDVLNSLVSCVASVNCTRIPKK